MTGTARLICLAFVVSVAGGACGDAGARAGDDGAGAGAGAGAGDPSVEAGTSAVDASTSAAGGGNQDGWRTADGIAFRQQRDIDLTGDGRNETVIATAKGPAYDSLAVAITIEGERRDTLWHESWPSLLYFKYDPPEGKADTTIARVVREHVEQLVAGDRFTMDGGLPPELSQGGDTAARMRDAVRYHLAELSYRLRADLSPVDPTPPEAFSDIDAGDVPATRVAAVIDEVRTVPSFRYFAGGEATYVIAWSAREGAFVRIYSCC